MGSVEEALQQSGIGTTGWASASKGTEMVRIARLLREREVRTVGLLPAADDVAVPALALALGKALADTGDGPVAVLDAAGTWVCADALRARAAPSGAPVTTSWLGDALAILTPSSVDPGEVLRRLRDAASGEEGGYRHLVVDLTGVDHLGAQVEAFDVLDATTLVARRGRTTARALRRALADVPPPRSLGVLLTGL
jgi:hypothetical protein